LRSALREIAVGAAGTIGFDDCSAALYDPAQRQLVTLASSNPTLDPPNARFALGEGIAGHVAATREAVLVPDASEDLRYVHLGRKRIASVLCVPIVREDYGLLGTITATSPAVGAFDSHHLNLLRMTADMAGLSMAHMLRARHARVLSDVGQGLLASFSIPDAFTVIREGLEQVLPLDVLHIRLSGDIQPSGLVWRGRDVQVGEFEIHPRVACEHGPQILSTDEFSRLVTTSIGDASLRSFVLVPLREDEGPGGYLLAASCADDVYTAEHRTFLTTLAGQFSLWVRSYTLYYRIRAERARLDTMFQSSSDAIIMFCNDMATRVNPAAVRLLGEDEHALLGRARDEILHVFPAASGGDSRLSVLHTRAGVREVEMDTRTLAADEPEDVVVTLRDVTDERELDRAKTAFISTVSHELRTPLNSVLGFADVLLTGIAGSLNERQREYVGYIRASSGRLTRLVNDILDLSHMDAGRLRLDLAPFLPEALVRDVAAALSPLAEEAGIEVRVETQPVALVEGDGGRIEQVLINLVGNALKFTPRGGTVRVRVGESDGQVIFGVTDTGPGIPREEQSRIFDRFYQLTSAPTLATTGSGLGLSIAKRLVEEHGGCMWVQSEVGRGSTFYFSIPLKSDRTV
jgi:signal transduction histidine kinase